MEIHPRLYSWLIDPLLRSLRRKILTRINSSDCVLDIACGTGILVRELAGICNSVTGIDMNERMIVFARKQIASVADNMDFREENASSLQIFGTREFSVSVFSLAIHQFFPAEHKKILEEAMRVSGRILIADYSFPLPKGPGKWIVYGIERMAGRDHYRNFRSYLRAGGIPGIIEKTGSGLLFSEVSVSGVFTVYQVES